MKEHNVTTQDHGDLPDMDWQRWSAWSGDLKFACDHDKTCGGDTEGEAVAAWARENGVRLWNEL